MGRFRLPSHPNTLTTQARLASEPVASLQKWLLDLLYPPRRISCGRIDTDWCDRCANQLATLPVVNPVTLHFDSLQGLASTSPHIGRTRRLLHALRCENARHSAHILAPRLAQQVAQLGWDVDATIAVPMHPERRRARGYNQAELLSMAAARLLDLPDYSVGVQRARYTRSQVGLNRQQRLLNVTGSFAADPMLITGKRLLLIDDVLTTGATLSECADALVASGAVAVFGLTVTAAVSLHI